MENDVAQATRESNPTRELVSESLPFLIASAVLFVAGILCYEYGVTWGPSVFPVWALLVTLGFVAAIGTAIAWYVAAERPRPGRAGAEGRGTGRTEESGRPRPEVSRASESEPWFEGPPATPSPSANRTSGTGNSPSVLDEIDQLEKDTARRSRRPSPEGP